MPPTLAAFIGGWEIVLILAIILVVFGARKWPDLFRGIGTGIREFRRAATDITEELQRASDIDAKPHASRQTRFSLAVFIAKGFGVGFIPFAPGTFGSILGIAWFALLVSFDSLWLFLFGAIEGIAFSIWLCDEAEKILGKTDPGSVVLDEIIALPFCFLPWVIVEWIRHNHQMPPLETFFSGKGLIWTAAIFVLFRIFDIWKPWPIRQLQHLPGGWGVTVDDLLAAVYVGAVSLLFVTL